MSEHRLGLKTPVTDFHSKGHSLETELQAAHARLSARERVSPGTPGSRRLPAGPLSGLRAGGQGLGATALAFGTRGDAPGRGSFPPTEGPLTKAALRPQRDAARRCEETFTDKHSRTLVLFSFSS